MALTNNTYIQSLKFKHSISQGLSLSGSIIDHISLVTYHKVNLWVWGRGQTNSPINSQSAMIILKISLVISHNVIWLKKGGFTVTDSHKYFLKNMCNFVANTVLLGH